MGKGAVAMSHEDVNDFEEGRSSMIRMLRTSAAPMSRKAKRELKKCPPAHFPPEESTQTETRSMRQAVNIAELESALTSEAGLSEKDCTTIRRIIESADEGVLTVDYRSHKKGRWYAKGVAQLQSCKNI